MTKEILIKLTPIEPYFLGNDRTFHYGEEGIKRIGSSKYFIKSDTIPSQTTLFGILRYLGIRNKTEDYCLEGSEKDVGYESFRFGEKGQTFGKIQHISPLLIINKSGRKLVRTPFNHIYSQNKKENLFFTPFSQFTTLSVTDGKDIYEKQMIPLDYNAKEYRTDTFVDIQSGAITKECELFSEIERAGNNIEKKVDGYFKMQFVNMKEGCCFAFYATVDKDFPEITDSYVYMGRRKSAFAVNVSASDGNGWKECTFAIKRTISRSPHPYFYCASDVYLESGAGSNPIEDLLSDCVFSVIQTTTLREYLTRYGVINQKDRFKKSDELYRMLEAGSVFYPAVGKVDSVRDMIENAHFKTIGMNCIIEGGNP